MTPSNTLKSAARLAAAGALFAVAAATAAPAWAHAHLKESIPARDADVSASPATVELVFTEALEAAFSGIELTGANGKAVKTGAATVAPADASRLVVPVEGLLAPGPYQITWHVLSVDGHKTQGRYNFTVK